MRTVEDGSEDLVTTSLMVYNGVGGSSSDSCSDDHSGQTPIRTESLQDALLNMMIPSDNQSTNAIQELFGDGNASAGRDAINDTMHNVVGMSVVNGSGTGRAPYSPYGSDQEVLAR